MGTAVTNINEAIEQRVREKTGRDFSFSALKERADRSKKPPFTVLCEIEKLITYKDLAEAFSEFSGIKMSQTRGHVIEVSVNRFIRSNEGEKTCLYVWHPSAVNTHRRGDEDVYILPKDIFDKICTENISRQKTTVNRAADAQGLLMDIIGAAVKQQATDIHIYPALGHGVYWVYFRLLGDLVPYAHLTMEQGKSLCQVIGNRVKEFTPSFKSDEVRRPQDGRIEIDKKHFGVALDIRVSFIWKPDMKSPDICMRMLYKTNIGVETLEQLGFLKDHADKMRLAAQRSRGIILVTGGTGTGKSRTLNTLLSQVDSKRNILTVEDPVEYELPNGRQFQIFEWEDATTKEIARVGFQEFAVAFKRHDPDVIFIGELRDTETADAAFHLAKTGHLVLATLHASRATMIPEILHSDYGIPIDVIADNVVLGACQVLVKKLCDNCKTQAGLENIPEWMSALRFKGDRKSLKNSSIFFANKDDGCDLCTVQSDDGNVVSRGYAGRTLVAEVYEFTPDLFEDGQVAAYKMEQKLQEHGNILTDGFEKVKAGIIEIDALRSLL